MLKNDNLDLLIKKYYSLINNYSIFFFNSIKDIENEITFNIYIKGIKLIENVFFISLFYLNSLNEVYNNVEKSYVYYIEFINQINLTNISNIFQNNESNFDLTIKDAIIFSYKKTVFTINSNIEDKKNKIQNILLEKFTLYNKFINNLFIIYYDYYIIYKKYNALDIISFYKDNILYIRKHIEKIKNNKISNKYFEIIINIIKTLYSSNYYSYNYQDKINKYNKISNFIDKIINIVNNNNNNKNIYDIINTII